ncbi:MAG: hypothetical protein J7J93_00005, partial [Candidatus Aenigmarchaeota archaeon]|nr:hypothetical protein [Candidatus Aenigmarchaeota archaeon]
MKNLNSLFIIASIFLFISTIAYAVDFESSVSPTSINEDTNMLLNFTINNTDSSVNITQVNISLPNTNFYFINDTNGTSASGTTFSNTSTVLTWTNTTSVGFIENGTVQYFWFNITASQPGTYNFTVTSLDTSGVSNSTNVSITINDTTSPLYSNQAQNTSTPIVGNGVLLSVYWTDNYNLSYAVLSTNETGAWANKTVYSSPLNLSGNTSWSNFTWSNSSVERATVVGWRIYANDTSNNWNVTDIMTFAYKSSNGASCSAASQCYGGYCVHGYCRSSSTYCGDGYCDSGETSSSCPSDCGSSGGGGGSGAVKPNQKILVKITPGVAQIVKFYDKDLEVKQIKIQVKNKVQNVKITITKVDGKPATITKEISGKVYKYMN